MLLQERAGASDYGAQQACSWENDWPSAVVEVAWLMVALALIEKVSLECELDVRQRVQRDCVDGDGGA